MRRNLMRMLAVLLAAPTISALHPSAARSAWVGPAGNVIAPAVHGHPPALVADGAGGVLVAFQGQGVPGGPALRVLRVSGAGHVAADWPAEGAVACSLASSTLLGSLRAVPDGAGGMFLAWIEDTVLLGPGPAFVQHVLADGSRATGWPARGRAVVAGTNLAALQALPDGAGGVLVAWGQGGVLRTMRIRANGTNAPGYPVAGRVVMAPASGGGVSPNFSIAPTDDGGYWLGGTLFSADTLSEPWSFRIQRLDSNGAIDLNWLGDGSGVEAAVASSALVNGGVGVAADGTGGVMLLAQHGDRAMLAHVLSDQTFDPTWPQAWLDLGDGGGLSGLSTALAADGSGGWYALWPRPLVGNRAMLRHVHGDGTLDPAWPAPLEFVAGELPSLVADAGGAFVGGTFYFTCPHQNCLGVAEIVRRTATGDIPSGWPNPADGLADPGGYALPADSFGGPMHMIADGTLGVFAAWTAPTVPTDGYGTLGTLRMMRFAGAGPVAGVEAPPGSGVLALGRARFTRAGIRVSCSGPAGGGARLEVFDVTGRRLLGAEVALSGGPSETLLSGSAALPAGLYLMRLRSGEQVARTRVLVTR